MVLLVPSARVSTGQPVSRSAGPAAAQVERFAAAKGGRNWAAINRALSKDPMKVIALLRLSPLMPFSVSNYLYGLTAIDFGSYVAGSWAGMLPGTVRTPPRSALPPYTAPAAPPRPRHHAPSPPSPAPPLPAPHLPPCISISRMAVAAFRSLRSAPARADPRNAALAA